METDFVEIDRGVVYITERRCRQVFPGCLFWVVFNSVQFYLSRQLTQENHGIVESKERIVHVFAWFRNWLHQNNAPCVISLFNKNTDVNVSQLPVHQYSISIQLGEKVNLLLKHRNCGHITGRSCVEYSVWGQSRGVVWGQLLPFLTFSYKVNI